MICRFGDVEVDIAKNGARLNVKVVWDWTIATELGLHNYNKELCVRTKAVSI